MIVSEIKAASYRDFYPIQPSQLQIFDILELDNLIIHSYMYIYEHLLKLLIDIGVYYFETVKMTNITSLISTT